MKGNGHWTKLPVYNVAFDFFPISANRNSQKQSVKAASTINWNYKLTFDRSRNAFDCTLWSCIEKTD